MKQSHILQPMNHGISMFSCNFEINMQFIVLNSGLVNLNGDQKSAYFDGRTIVLVDLWNFEED